VLISHVGTGLNVISWIVTKRRGHKDESKQDDFPWNQPFDKD
jgi:hypothetical protein